MLFLFLMSDLPHISYDQVGFLAKIHYMCVYKHAHVYMYIFTNTSLLKQDCEEEPGLSKSR